MFPNSSPGELDRVERLALRVEGLGLGFRVAGPGLGCEGLGFQVPIRDEPDN